MLSQRLMQAAAAGTANNQTIPIEEVFSAYTYTGNNSTQTITNGIDLAGKGGMVWAKHRTDVFYHYMVDTIRGVTNYIYSNDTSGNDPSSSVVTSFNSNGFSIGGGAGINQNTKTFIAWSFAVAPKFFYQAQVVVSGGVTATVDLSSLGTVGMVAVKRTDSTSAWFTLHRSNTAGKICYLNTTAAETTDGSITLSGTTLSLVGGTIANGTYIIYAWAHDTSANGLIQCGGFTSDGSGNASVTLGFEPQWVLWKSLTAGNNWNVADTARNMSNTGMSFLKPNTSAAETVYTTDYLHPTATGVVFSNGILNASESYIYLAIRRGPMKLPTAGTQVYNAILTTGNGAGSRAITGYGFPPDLYMLTDRGAAQSHFFDDRLRGISTHIKTEQTNAETTNANYGIQVFDTNGFTMGTAGGDGTDGFNISAHTYIFHGFRRYPGVFDVVAYTGTGANATVTHNLTVAPELWIVKGRSGATAWTVGCTAFANTEYLVINTTAAKATDATAWNSTFPTSAALSLGTQATVNTNTATYVAYLFATLAGVSKVGSYTGDGTTGRVINCGFSTGARFILIKRTDSTGDWYVYDTTRTYPAGNDYHLSLNTTAAEVVTTDDVDYDASGFIVNQNTTTNINVSTATYIYLAFA